MSRFRFGKTVVALTMAAGLFACLTAGFLWFLPRPPERSLDGGASPCVVLSQTECDVGAVPQGEVVRATFPVRNAGRRSLLLLEKTGGCCGQPSEVRAISVPPGEEAELTVKFDTAQARGLFQQTVRYGTNDRNTPKFALRLRGVVEPPPQPKADEASPQKVLNLKSPLKSGGEPEGVSVLRGER